MRMEWVFVSPERARTMLGRNEGNRQRRPSTVSHYADQMKRGEWQQTHQPLAFDEDGNLIDGQHRLAAVAQSGIGIWFWCCTYGGKAVANNLPIDLQARRTAADILRQDKRAAEVASVLARINGWASKGVPVDVVRDNLILFGKHIAAVNDVSRQKRTPRTAATVRAAVVLRCAEAPSDAKAALLVAQYEAFVMMNFDTCWPSVKALIKQFDAQSSATLGKGSNQENFRLVRTWKAFDLGHTQASTIRVGAEDTSLQEMRQLLNAAAAGLAAAKVAE